MTHKAVIHAGRKEPKASDLSAVKSTMRGIPREPEMIAPILAKGEGAGAGAAEIFVRDCETAVDEAEAVRNLPHED